MYMKITTDFLENSVLMHVIIEKLLFLHYFEILCINTINILTILFYIYSKKITFYLKDKFFLELSNIQIYQHFIMV